MARQARNPLTGLDGCVPGTGINGQSASSAGGFWAPWESTLNPPTIEWDGNVPSPGSNYGTRVIARLFGSTDIAYQTTPMPTPKNWNAPHAITWSIEIEVAEQTKLEWLDPTEAVYVDGVPYPIYGGNAMPDNLPALRRLFREVALAGATATATVSCGGASASVSVTLGSSTVIPAYAITSTILATTSNVNGSYYSTVEWNDGDGGNPGFPTYNYSQGPGSGWGTSAVTIAAADSGWSLSGSLTNTIIDDPCIAGQGTVASGEATLTVSPPIEREYRGRVRVWDQPYPDNGVLTVSHPTGSAAVTDGAYASSIERLRFYSMQAKLNGVTKPLSELADEYSNAKCALAGMSGGTSNEDEDDEDRRDFRMQIRGYPWTAGTLAHASSHTVLPAGDDSWSGGTATGIGYRIGEGQTATATLTGLERIWEAYRYFDVGLKGNGFASREVTITLGNDRISRTYKTTTGADGSSVTRTVDGCSPSNVPSPFAVDRRDNRYPLRYQASGSESPIATGPEESTAYLDDVEGYDDEPESVRGWLWGINRPTTMTVSCSLGSGETLEIGAVMLRRTTRNSITFLDPFKGGATGFDGYRRLWSSTAAGGDTTVTGSVRGGPFATLESDGRIAFDFAGYWRDEPVVGSPGWVYVSVDDMAGWFEAFPGVTWTGGTPPNDYIDNGAYALYLGGGGDVATVDDEGVVTWDSWIEHAVGNVTAQELLDEVADYPGFGNGLQGGAFGVTSVYPSSKSLRTRAEGLVFDTATRLPIESEEITTTDDVDSSDSGSGLTDAIGFYRTGLPFGQAPRSHTTTRGTDTDSVTWRNRWRERSSWLKLLRRLWGDNWLAYTPWAQLHVSGWRVTLEEGHVRRAPDVLPPFETDLTLSSNDTERAFRIAYLPGSAGRIALVWQSEGEGVRLAFSDDDSETFSTSTVLIPNAVHPTVTAVDSALVVAAVRPDSPPNGPGIIVAKIHGPGGWSSEITFATETGDLRVEDDTFHLAPIPEVAGRLALVARAEGEDGPSIWHCADLTPGATSLTFTPA